MTDFATEADLCAAFISEATNTSARRDMPKWVAYPETAGFDILMVREDGAQIGIEAKLVLNAHVISQALPARADWLTAHTGPDHRAVLVPRGKVQNHLVPICDALGITILTFAADMVGKPWGSAFDPRLPWATLFEDHAYGWHFWAPTTRCAVPDYVPDVIAGASAPVSLSAWKVKAIRLSVLLDERPVTRADFKHFQLSPTMWLCPKGWLDRTERGWVRGPRTPDFKAQHPRNYAEIAADKPRWAPPIAAKGLVA